MFTDHIHEQNWNQSLWFGLMVDRGCKYPRLALYWAQEYWHRFSRGH